MMLYNAEVYHKAVCGIAAVIRLVGIGDSLLRRGHGIVCIALRIVRLHEYIVGYNFIGSRILFAEFGLVLKRCNSVLRFGVFNRIAVVFRGFGLFGLLGFFCFFDCFNDIDVVCLILDGYGAVRNILVRIYGRDNRHILLLGKRRYDIYMLTVSVEHGIAEYRNFGFKLLERRRIYAYSGIYSVKLKLCIFLCALDYLVSLCFRIAYHGGGGALCGGYTLGCVAV